MFMCPSSSSPLVVVWRVTEHCNLQCPFCAYDSRLERPRGMAAPAEIRRFAGVLAEWSEFTSRPVLLSWLGGEPLLWRPLAALTQHCHETLNLRLSTTTNGTTLHRPEVRKLLQDCYTEVTVSVDGPAAVHDGLRGRAGVHDRVREGVQALAGAKKATGRGPLLRANVVLLRPTVTSFPTLCETLADWGIEEITCNQLGGLDRPEYYPDHRLLPAQVDWIAAHWMEWQEHLAVRGVRLLGSEAYLHRLAMTAQGKRLPVADCQPGHNFLFIDEGGRVAPCSYTPAQYGVPTQTLSTAADLMALPTRLAQARREFRAAACEDCHSTQVCAKFTGEQKREVQHEKWSVSHPQFSRAPDLQPNR